MANEMFKDVKKSMVQTMMIFISQTNSLRSKLKELVMSSEDEVGGVGAREAGRGGEDRDASASGKGGETTVSEKDRETVSGVGGETTSEKDGQTTASGKTTAPGKDGEATAPGKNGEATAPGKDGEATAPGKNGEATAPGKDGEALASGEGVMVKVYLRDINEAMVAAWKDKDAFGSSTYKELVEVSLGDIFTGAPAADAIVSPANSFGFMDGGIDMVYSRHFGWQMQERLQKLLRSDYDGELPVGEAVVIPAYPEGEDLSKLSLSTNQGKPIHYLISAPTMRIPTNVNKTVNAYLAFRAILRAVKQHNLKNPNDPIRTVLCPGLGTAVGRMPVLKCAVQMRVAYEAVMFKSVDAINRPIGLSDCCTHHVHLYQVGSGSSTQFSAKPHQGELYLP